MFYGDDMLRIAGSRRFARDDGLSLQCKCESSIIVYCILIVMIL